MKSLNAVGLLLVAARLATGKGFDKWFSMGMTTSSILSNAWDLRKASEKLIKPRLMPRRERRFSMYKRHMYEVMVLTSQDAAKFTCPCFSI